VDFRWVVVCHLKKKIDIEKLASKYHLTTVQIRALIQAFQKEGNKKGHPIKLKDFLKVVETVRDQFPEAGDKLCKDAAEVAFRIFDEDHSGGIDPYELINGFSIILSDNIKAKAELAFRAIDLDGNGSISRKELITHVELIHKIAKRIVESAAGKEGGFMLKFAAKAVLGAGGHGLIKDTVDKVFSAADSDSDGVITLEEWVSAVTVENEVLIAMIDPLQATKIYDEFSNEFKKC